MFLHSLLFTLFLRLPKTGNGCLPFPTTKPQQPTTSKSAAITATNHPSNIITSFVTQECEDYHRNLQPNAISDFCSQFLNYNCTNRFMSQTHLFTSKEKNLMDILLLINEKCNCRNRTIELFCRYTLPECLINSTNCEIPDSYQPNVTLPCSQYCHKLVNK